MSTNPHPITFPCGVDGCRVTFTTQLKVAGTATVFSTSQAASDHLQAILDAGHSRDTRQGVHSARAGVRTHCMRVHNNTLPPGTWGRQPTAEQVAAQLQKEEERRGVKRLRERQRRMDRKLAELRENTPEDLIRRKERELLLQNPVQPPRRQMTMELHTLPTPGERVARDERQHLVRVSHARQTQHTQTHLTHDAPTRAGETDQESEARERAWLVSTGISNRATREVNKNLTIWKGKMPEGEQLPEAAPQLGGGGGQQGLPPVEDEGVM